MEKCLYSCRVQDQAGTASHPLPTAAVLANAGFMFILYKIEKHVPSTGGSLRVGFYVEIDTFLRFGRLSNHRPGTNNEWELR